MNILILTYGTRGDVQPYLALGLGLQRAGHNVTLATSERFEDFVADHGLRFAPLGDDLLKILDTDLGKEIIEGASSIFGMIGAKIKVAKQMGPIQRQLLEDCWQAAQQAQPELIIFHPKAYGGPLIAEKLKRPAIFALPFPMLVPTDERPFMVFPPLKLGAYYNRMTYAFVSKMVALFSNKYVKEWRREHGLPPIKNFSFLTTADGAPIPVLHGYSEHIIARPKDWPPHAYISGYWFLDDAESAENWTPPAELRAFLEAGPAPIYFGFGSIAGQRPEQSARAVIDALQDTGQRGLIATGWGGLKADELPETIFKIESAPHTWLFPRMAAIVHHGGAGTTAAAARAGKPMLICPFFGDQPFWGKQIYQLGLGPAPIPQKKLNRAALIPALKELTSNQEMRTKAAQIGTKIRAENGVDEAVKIIEKLMAEQGA